ncbi:MAG: 50S ribosomal protein L29 [Malacoplasma sp.]|nr:50S ribosomal protein L29 [Malacoplasma sp.]
MIKDLRTKSDNELGNLISKLKVQLLEMRFKIANGEVEGVHKLKEIRKTIAMAMTVLSERNVKISFSTFNTQLIKEKDGKQQIIGLPIVTEKDSKTVSNHKQKPEPKKETDKNVNKTNQEVKKETTLKKVETKTDNKKSEPKKNTNKPVSATKTSTTDSKVVSKNKPKTANKSASKKPTSSTKPKTPAKGKK